MTAVLISVETLLLVLLLVLVAGLLRSHAEILRRLNAQAPMAPGVATPSAASGARRDEPAPPVSGATPDGGALTLSFEPGTPAIPTLLAFLTSGCGTCAGFWESLSQARLPAGVQTLIVTHGPEREQPARVAALAAQAGIPVVMSSRAWEDYSVPGAPYFVLVDGSIRGEGVATTWHALSSLVSDAIADAGVVADAGAPGPDEATRVRASDGTSRARHVDEVFAAAGIGPEDPSLYPAGRPEP